SADLTIRTSDWMRGLCGNAGVSGIIRVTGDAPPGREDKVPADALAVMAAIPLPGDGKDLIITTPLLTNIQVEAIHANGKSAFAFGPAANFSFSLSAGQDKLIHLNPACAINKRLEELTPVVPLFVGDAEEFEQMPDLRTHDCTNACGGGSGGTGSSSG